MKRILIAFLALASSVAFGTTLNPVQLLNPAGSTAGQAVVSTGASSAPGWANVTASGLVAQAANTVVANVTASSASPTAVAIPSCSTANSAIQYTSGTGYSCGTTFGLTSSGLNQFASTTSAQLAGVISDETGTGALVFGTNPSFAGFTTTAATTFGASANVSYNTPAININDTSAAATARTSYQSNGTNVWALVSNSPSGNLQVNRYVSGTLTDQPISISNSTGIVTMPDGLTVNGTVSGTGFSTYLASPPAIGGTAANTGKFTTLQSTSAYTPSSTSGIVGTTTNDNANAGSWGEYFSTTGTSTGLTSGSYVDLATQSLTAGDWDTQCVVNFNGSSLAASVVVAGINTVANTQPGATAGASQFLTFSSGVLTGATMISPVVRESLSTTTTVRCGGAMTFSAGTVNATGTITARRRR